MRDTKLTDPYVFDLAHIPDEYLHAAKVVPSMTVLRADAVSTCPPHHKRHTGYLTWTCCKCGEVSTLTVERGKPA